MLETIPGEIEERLENGTLVSADTLEELAEKIGVPAEAFVASVEAYNAACEAGVDSQFGVVEQMLYPLTTAPYYATRIYASNLSICYGVHVNDDSQVCTDDDQPIAGLFAAGNCQGDFFGFNYPVHCPGCSTGRSLVYGQLIGEALAQDMTIGEMLATR